MFAVIGVAGIEPATDVVDHHEKMRSDEHFVLYLSVGIAVVAAIVVVAVGPEMRSKRLG